MKEMSLPGAALHVAPATAENSASAGAGEGAAWVVNAQGQVSLVNRDLENLRGFPISTGVTLSAPPGAWGGKLFLPDENGSVHTVDNRASVSRWGASFSAALRSPPSFIDVRGKTYAAVYPKGFFGEIFLLDSNGNPLPHWPVPVSGIAFGSPLLFVSRYDDTPEQLLTAFITQAGELGVYTEDAALLPGFPVELDGVFYLQPVFDGEKLWIIESDGTLYSVNLYGEVWNEKIPRLSVKEGGYITTADIGEGAVGIFITGEGNALYGYSRDFNALEGFPLPVWGKPVFGDLNADGKIEAAGIGMDNKLYMWQFR
jgi:hypothetical protein